LVQTGDIKAANLYILNHEQEYGEFGLAQSKLWDEGTLCITIAANIAETAILGYPMCFPDSVVGFKADREKSSELFMYYVFEYIRDSIQNSASGSIQDNINIDYLTSLEFKIPSKCYQDKIVKILSDIDKKIINNKRINDNLQNQLTLMFDYFFNNSHHSKVFANGVLADISYITMGQSPSGDTYNEIGAGIPFYQGSTDFGEIFPTIRVYTTEPSREACLLDTLMSVRAPVGTMNIAYENCCIGRGLAAIRGKNNNNTFVRYLLKRNKWYFDAINNSGTTFGSITKDYLYGMPIIIPDTESVEEFEDIAQSYESKIFRNETETRALSKLRDWLLPMLMNGQLVISD